MRWLVVVGAVIVALAPAPVVAQGTASDSAAVTSAVAASLLLDLRGDKNHRGPVIFAMRRDTSSASTWMRRIHAALREEAPEEVIDTAAPSALRFSLQQLLWSSDSIVVLGAFSRCYAGSTGMSFWSHSVRIVIPHSNGNWVATHPTILARADGTCSAGVFTKPGAGSR
ncbi:MAG TPA: hypothetical protein VGM77_01970 [Gemmatimonadales bacterium]